MTPVQGQLIHMLQSSISQDRSNEAQIGILSNLVNNLMITTAMLQDQINKITGVVEEKTCLDTLIEEADNLQEFINKKNEELGL